MADVARAAGVSKQTVSRVLNDLPIVSPETRKRVHAAMEELNYRPNHAARALSSGKSATVGVLLFDTVNYGPAKLLQGINQCAGEMGYMITVVPLEGHDHRTIRSALDQLLARSVDGIIAIVSEDEMAEALLDLSLRLPVVAVDQTFADHVPVVTIDEHEAAATATQHLLDLGHRTVWHLAGPPHSVAARERTEGWRATLEAAGAPVPEPVAGDWSPLSGYRQGSLLAADPGVTAVFSANDQMAVGLLRALHEAGRRVPEDVSVVGFDDTPEAAQLIPPLSTMRPHFLEAGRQCMSVLLTHIRSPEERPSRSLVPSDLVVRSSSARARR